MHQVVIALSLLLCTIGAESKARGKRSVSVPCFDYHPKPGQFVPRCTPSGFFNIIQIDRPNRFMWCVNPETGEKTKDFDPAPGPHVPKCGECFYALVKFYASSLFASPLGQNKPECDADGLFKPQQRSPSTGYTWCVNVETGEKIQGSDVAPAAGQANCEAGRKKRQVAGPCHAVRFSLRPVGQYIPQCTVFGYYSVIQRHPSTGYSWCANPETGAKVGTSDTAPGAGEPQCGKCLFELLEYYSAGRVPIGRQYPQCDDQGRYKSLQHSASTGYSWCVNPETGAKIEGSAVAPAAGKANC